MLCILCDVRDLVRRAKKDEDDTRKESEREVSLFGWRDVAGKQVTQAEFIPSRPFLPGGYFVYATLAQVIPIHFAVDPKRIPLARYTSRAGAQV